MSVLSNDRTWLSICGENDSRLAQQLEEAVGERMRRGDYTDSAKRYVEKVSLALVKGSLVISDKQLEKLRRMCQLWDVDIRAAQITSHRRLIGPFIVAFKKALFPVLRVLLKDLLEQQREFNAATISLCAELANESKVQESAPEK